MVVTRGWGRRGIRSYYLLDTEFHFCKMKKVLEMNGRNGCTTILMNLKSLNCAFKMVKMVNLCHVCFSTIF